MDTKKGIQIRYDREVNGLSYRNLGEKYGIGHTRIYRMLKSKQKKVKEEQTSVLEEPVPAETFEGDEKALREELRKVRLENELLKLVIDISSKELGVDLRKKHGARRSK